MWTTIALLSVLAVAPAQADLSLTNVHSTHGLLGPQRQDDTLAPGDMLFVCFDIEGIRIDEEGKVRYSMAIELSDASGKVVFRQAPKEKEARASLGGASVPAFARLNVGLDTPRGDYQMKITVKDLASGREQSLTRGLKVLAKSFALVRTTVTLDTDAHYSAAVFTCGQGVWVQSSAVGFAQDRGKKPKLVFEMRVLDEAGRPTLAKSVTGMPPKELPNNLFGLPLAFPLTLNRPGKFTVELQASDQVSGKKTRISIPILVQAAPKG